MAVRTRKWLQEALDATKESNSAFDRLDAQLKAIAEYLLSQVSVPAKKG